MSYLWLFKISRHVILFFCISAVTIVQIGTIAKNAVIKLRTEECYRRMKIFKQQELYLNNLKIYI